MSLYEEALVEAKKLKEIAEADAKQAIVEEITPHIRKMIASSLAGKSNSLLYEEEEKSGIPDPTGVAPVADPAGTVDPGTPPSSTDATMAPPPSSDPPVTATAVGAPAGGSLDAPIQAADALNMPMPGPDGKLVVDFDDLFQPSEPGDDSGAGDEGSGSAEMTPEVPGGMPSPTPVDVNPTPADATIDADTAGGAGFPGAGDAMAASGQGNEPQDIAQEPQLETYELFSEALNLTAKRVHKAYTSRGIPSLMKEALQDKLFQLIESLEILTEKKLVTENLSQILESRLEILHLKLQEAVLTNTYEGTKGTDMASKSLKEFAAKMLSESETIEGGPITSPADVHKSEKSMTVQNANDSAADKAGTHAQKVTEPTVTLKTEAAELAKLEEELRALIAEDEGDSLADDEGKQNLAGAASTIPDKKVGHVDVTKTPAGGPSNPASYVQGVSENIEHSKETGSEQKVDKTSTGHPKKESVAVSGKALNERTKKLKAEGLRKQIAALQEQLKECGMEMETEAAGNGLPAPGVPQKKSVMGEDDTVINFNFDLSDLVGGLDGLSDDDEIEIVDDEEGVDLSGASDFGGDMDSTSDLSDTTDDIDLGDEEETEPSGLEVGADEEEETGSDMPLSERIRRARKSAKTTLAENKSLKTQLAEQTLFNAKVVHLQPFLNNRNLTKEQKQKIVEYLDRGKTVNEVKTIYTRVKTVLDSAQKAKAKTGSSSRPIGAGAANLNESVSAENLYEGAVLVEAEKNRLMELAGIRRK